MPLLGPPDEAPKRIADPQTKKVVEDMKNQLILVLIGKLADKTGEVIVPVAEIDATDGLALAMGISEDKQNFIFQIIKN